MPKPCVLRDCAEPTPLPARVHHDHHCPLPQPPAPAVLPRHPGRRLPVPVGPDPDGRQRPGRARRHHRPDPCRHRAHQGNAGPGGRHPQGRGARDGMAVGPGALCAVQRRLPQPFLVRLPFAFDGRGQAGHGRGRGNRGAGLAGRGSRARRLHAGPRVRSLLPPRGPVRWFDTARPSRQAVRSFPCARGNACAPMCTSLRGAAA